MSEVTPTHPAKTSGPYRRGPARLKLDGRPDSRYGKQGNGPVLCERHAHQYNRQTAFSGDCEPLSEWLGGLGQVVRCAATSLGAES